MSNLFYEDFKINQPLRLIELFAGYGSQSLGFKKLGIPHEHHFVCEFDKYAIKSYNAIHGTDFPALDIKNIHAKDLNIVDTDKYCYFLTYSFPCTDISVAGKMAAVKDGLKKGGNTRSGLLWEVERLLEECTELPQVLFMENVPGVATLEGFKDWCLYLEKKGYSNYWNILNAKDYGIPQNRERCYMFSFLGDWCYEFPSPVKLEKRLKDILEDKVDEKYYLYNEKAQKLIDNLIERNIIPSEQNRTEQNRTEQNRTDTPLIYQSTSQNLQKKQTVSRQELIAEYQTNNKLEMVLLNGNKIPAAIGKISEDKKKFLSVKDAYIKDINQEIAHTLTLRYYKGVGGHNDNIIIEKEK